MRSLTAFSTSTARLLRTGLALLLACAWMAPSAVQAQDEVADTVNLELPLPHGADVPNPTEAPGGVSLGFPDVIEYGVDYDETTGSTSSVNGWETPWISGTRPT